MPELVYTTKNFSETTLEIINSANGICAAFAQEGYDLTLRQLFYQFVSRALLPNTEQSYKRLGAIVSDARLAGMIDWNYIVDRTRNLRRESHWSDPESIMESAAESYATDKWASQRKRVEVWIEKDALIGVLDSCCPAEDVPYFSCRGYTSQSEVWAAAQRIGGYIRKGQPVVILHLGDHDPSGIDMTRDIEERLSMFIAQDVLAEEPGLEPWQYVEAVSSDLTIERIALNEDQIQQYNPPPNPAKLSDSRARSYIQRFGRSSWELDALGPAILANLIVEGINRHRDPDVWDEAVAEQEDSRTVLTAISERWSDVREFVKQDEEE